MAATQTTRTDRRSWLRLAVLALVPFLLSLDLSVLFLALPQLSAALAPNSTEQLWISDIYPFMLAGFLMPMGTLGDRIGRKRLLLIGAAVFGACSILAAYSVSPGMLIAARAVLGIAGAALLPSALALVTTIFPDAKRRGLAIGVWISCFMSGMALGPVIGGALLQAFWWGAAFLIGVPVMVVLLALGPRVLPEYRDPHGGPIDALSVVLSLATVLPVVYGLKGFAREGYSTVYLVAVVVGLVFGWLFVRRQYRLKHPLLDVRLFTNRTFGGGTGIMLLASSAMAGTLLLASQYLQQVRDLSPVVAGLFLVLPATGLVLGSVVSPIIARRIRPGFVVAGGFSIAVVGFLVLTQVSSTGSIAVPLIGLFLVQIGISPGGAVGTDLVVNVAPARKAGSASALTETATELGTALGIAGLGTLTAVVYHGRMANVSDAEARDTLPGALSAAHRAPTNGEALAHQAREAFTNGVTLAAGVCTGILVLLCVLTLVLLRAPAPRGQTD